MVEVSGKIRVIEGTRPDAFPLAELLQEARPAVLKGLARDWGLVRAGSKSDAEARRYLASFYNGKPVDFSFGDPSVAGRPFYNEDFTRLNFTVRRERLDKILEEIESHLDDEKPPTYYVASLLVDPCMPGFRRENDLDFAAHGVNPPPSIWIGNRTTASCHYDAPNNIACVAVGRRRFTLFPP
ncbi:MAG TPA: cupin-like domain-containing protein, partial [Rhodothermales bacterium]